jgi:phosphate transport system substrate-binding protein
MRLLGGRFSCLLATLVVGASLALFSLGTLGSGDAGASEPQMTSTGSSFAGVAISQWQGQFNELYGGNINFNVSSSVIGMNDFCQATVDFGATDIAYSTGQSVCSTSQVPYPFQYMPTVAGGLAFEYNVTGQNGQQVTNLVLDPSTLEGIFTGAINNWDNGAIAALNPDIRLPNEPITAYYRGDPSGENYLLGDYFLHTANAGELAAFQGAADVPSTAGQPSATWAVFQNGTPPNYASLVSVNGADAASQEPKNNAGGIAYVETAYAKNVDMPVASVVNAAGDAVQPSSYNVAVALTGAILYQDLTQNLAGVYTNTNPYAYPLSAYSYFAAQCVPGAAAAQNFACDSSGNVTMGTAQGAEMAQFIQFVACLGQSKMAQLGYSPIPPNLVEDDFQAAGRLPGGTTPPPPTAATCANPYITGALQPVGEPTVVGSANPGGSDVGAAGGAAGAASAGASTAASHASGAGGLVATQSVSGPGSSAAAAKGGAGALAKKKAEDALTDPVKAYARQDGLTSAASRSLLVWSPTVIALWSVVFAVILIGVPLAAWFWQRRRKDSGGIA